MDVQEATSDELLEKDIQRAKEQFLVATTIEERHRWLRLMDELISRRSPE